MRTFHYTKDDEFCIFVEKRGGAWFEICGRGHTPNDAGRYLGSAEADKEFERLTANGFKRRPVKGN